MRRTVTPSSAASFDALPDPVLLDIFARTDFATRHAMAFGLSAPSAAD